LEAVAPGHYARLVDDSQGRRRLLRARDSAKDQSYFLFEMTQKQLAKAVFPLGELSKSEVRRIASELGLETATKPESQEICFVPDGDYARFVEDYARSEMGSGDLPQRGPITNVAGGEIGEHSGLHHYTIGQRRGIGVSSTEPLYVVNIEIPRNRLVVGNRSDVLGGSLIATGVNWVSIPAPEKPIRATVKIRYRSAEAPATVTSVGRDEVKIEFDEPQPAITPGQATVFYQGDIVAGGGWIKERC